MSRSWTRPGAWWRSPPPVGLALGRTDIAAVRLFRRRDGWHMEHWLELPLAVPLFEGPAGDAAAHALADVLERVRREFGSAARTVQVSLPDPAVSLRVFKVEQLPAGRRLQGELVRWRFAREFGCGIEQFHCAHQVYGPSASGQRVLGLALAADWSALVLDACRKAGFIVTNMDMDACHRHNRVQAGIAKRGRGGVLVALQPWTWSLAAWDSEGRLCFVRSRWRAALDDPQHEGEEEAIAQEVQRIVRLHARSLGTDEPLTLGVIAHPAQAERMSARLDGRTRERCEPLPAGMGLPIAGGELGAAIDLTSPAFAAALPR